jgi:hypothetical protein
MKLQSHNAGVSLPLMTSVLNTSIETTVQEAHKTHKTREKANNGPALSAPLFPRADNAIH